MTIKTEQPELASTQETEHIKKACLRLLVHRDHSKKEIQNKLAGKGFDRDRVGEAVDELAGRNWQNDDRYAENYARVRSQKGFGPLRIAYELGQQGIDAEKVESVLSALSDNWPALLETVYLKKYPGHGRIDMNERAKRTRFFQYRGFPNSMINSLLDRQSKKLT